MTKAKGTPAQGLFGATLGFFIGFAAVALFGTTAGKFQEVMHLGPLAVAVLVATPSLTGALLRIPFSAWVDTTGGRKPFLVLLSLSVIGMAGLAWVVRFYYPAGLTPGMYPLLLLLALLCGCGIAGFSVGAAQVSYWYPQAKQGSALAIFGGAGNLAPGIFSFILPLALTTLGLAGSYLVWLGMLATGTVLYALFGRNAWYFQFLAGGASPAEARAEAERCGQSLFPARSLTDSLKASAGVWKTWALVVVYFTTFGGFMALTAWFPTYWRSAFGLSAVSAGLLTGTFSVLTSLIRVGGGMLADKLSEGGENTSVLALLIMIIGAVVMLDAHQYELAVPGIILLAFGMGLCNAAVFKIVPQAVPHAVGGAAGWVGGLGALGGFIIPLVLGMAVRNLGQNGYAIGFIVFIFLGLLSLSLVWVLKYSREIATAAAQQPHPAVSPQLRAVR
jgi:NNP family nitrate/nitrite transporter-like MFS transporter